MTQLMLPKTVRAVHIVGAEGSTAIYLHERKRKKRKDTKHLRPIRKDLRKLLGSEQVGLTDFTRRFDKSNRKRKDGWLSDLTKNLTGSGRKSEKKVLKVFKF